MTTVNATILTGNFFGDQDTTGFDTEKTINVYRESCEKSFRAIVDGEVEFDWNVQNAEGYHRADSVLSNGEPDDVLKGEWDEVCSHEFGLLVWEVA